MTNEHYGITDGTYTLAEGDERNTFYFYRNDEGIIGDVGRLPVEFLETYISIKMMEGEITKTIVTNFRIQTSVDGKIIRITLLETETKAESEKSGNEPKKQGIFKRIFGRIFK